MIRSESEYRDALERIADERLGLENRRAFLQAENFTPEEVERGLGPLQVMHQSLVDEVEEYEQVQRRDLRRFNDLRDLNRLLVAGRLASGLSGRELAQRLGVSESQVSRDERNEYDGVTVERAGRILEVLGVEVSLSCRMAPVQWESDDVPFNVNESPLGSVDFQPDFPPTSPTSRHSSRTAA